ncbi:PepSY domain-containing protein [Mastigocoleus testarum]|uniref:PepSY domain-containing protein n=1 Tax=Mastigocoleus testarum BC008 TaxID=371196 RepID=A0A0V7ZSB1_9CYAN|nr:PepSY domain-containing protein [Mastigocoleus testarum]KST67400.1 hypothetical protein BC008_29850 [Mastigocoleus testarum BC008]
MENSIKALLTTLLVTTLGVAGVSPVVRAESPNEEQQERQIAAKLRPYAKITAEQAKKAAQSTLKGEVEEVELDANENRSLYYEVESEKTVVYVDAGNGKVLGSEPAGKEGAVEDSLQSSVKVPNSVQLPSDR